MIECKTIEEAMAVEGVVHIESGEVVIAYQAGDKLPAHCIVDEVAQEQPSEIEVLKARIDALERKVP